MNTALVTGTSSGIGYEIASKLIKEGYIVYGISRTQSKLADPNFHEILMDLDNLSLLYDTIQTVMANDEIVFDLLVNNAGCGYYGLHENQSPIALHEMLTTNLEVPFLLTNQLLRSMKEHKHGVIMNISSFTANRVNPHGAAYGATKAALSSFSDSIFEEGRKHGIRVILLEPEMTDTNLYRNADFTASSEEGAYLSADEVAKCAIQALCSDIGYQRITLQPQYRRIERKK